MGNKRIEIDAKRPPEERQAGLLRVLSKLAPDSSKDEELTVEIKLRKGKPKDDGEWLLKMLVILLIASVILSGGSC